MPPAERSRLPVAARQQLGDRDKVFTALFGLSSYYSMRGEHATARTIADQMLPANRKRANIQYRGLPSTSWPPGWAVRFQVGANSQSATMRVLLSSDAQPPMKGPGRRLAGASVATHDLISVRTEFCPFLLVEPPLWGGLRREVSEELQRRFLSTHRRFFSMH